METTSPEELAGRYLDALLDARRRDAMAMIHGAVRSGQLGIQDLYLRVFAPVLHEVGRRWERNEISIAQEHFISAATQQLMASLYAELFAVRRRGRRMIAACVGEELHEIGLRMVADFFELDGWDTYYLGANLPVESLIEAARTRRAELVALSATMPRHIERVREVIAGLRAEPTFAQILVFVGGGAFAGDEARWRSTGADGFTRDALSAVALANRILDAREPRP